MTHANYFITILFGALGIQKTQTKMKTKSLPLILSFVAIILLASSIVRAQDYPRLNVIFKKDFNTKATIFVEPIIADVVFSVELLKNSLKNNGFAISEEETKSDYVIKMTYKSRNDTGCNGTVIKKMEGRIIDSKGETFVVFNFGQSGFEGKCTKDVMNGLAYKLKTEYKKK